MSNFQDLTGQKFGRLTVLERAESKGKRTYWRCKCDCGNECTVVGTNLRSGHTKSCGCLVSEVKDLSGLKFGRLTVLNYDHKDASNKSYWLCECECGNECTVQGYLLTSGKTKSCGCLTRECNTTHGMCHSKIHETWTNIKQRCFNPNNKAYKNYGERGITMYTAWIDDFQAFYEYVSTLEHYGEEGYTLDRENNDGNYEPGNLRWATKKEQQRNRRSNIFVEYNGKKMTLAEASEKSKVCHETLRERLGRGLTGFPLFLLPTNKK